MPSEFVQYQQVEENMEKLLTFLDTYFEILPKSFHLLNDDLNAILPDFHTTHMELRDMVNATVVDDSIRRQQHDHRNRIYEIIFQFKRDCLRIRRLYEKDLKGQSDTQALAENLLAILTSIEEEFEELLRSPRSVDVYSSASAQPKSGEGERLLPGETAEEPASFINRESLKELTDLQLKLNNLVLGYIMSRRQWVLCDEIKSKLLEGKSENPKNIPPRMFWNEINKLIEKAHRPLINKDFPTSLRSDLFDKFILALNKAQQVLESVSSTSLRDDNILGIQTALDDALNHVDSAIFELESITEECENGANNAVPRIDQIIKGIFKKEPGPSKSSESPSIDPRTPRPEEQQEFVKGAQSPSAASIRTPRPA